MRALALYTVGNMTPGRPPRVMQRTHCDASSGPSNGPLPNGAGPADARWRPSAEIGGRRPSGGSMTTDVRREASPTSIQCDGGSVDAPAKIPLGLLTCFNRCSNSASVSHSRVPKDVGRSNGVVISAPVDHTPCRSGSPHGVRGAFQSAADIVSGATLAAAIAAAKRRSGCRMAVTSAPRPRSDADRAREMREQCSRGPQYTPLCQCSAMPLPLRVRCKIDVVRGWSAPPCLAGLKACTTSACTTGATH